MDSSYSQSLSSNSSSNMEKNIHIIVDQLSVVLKTKLHELLSDLLIKSNDLDETNRILLTLPIVKNVLLQNTSITKEPEHFSSDIKIKEEKISKITQTCTFNYNSLLNNMPSYANENKDNNIPLIINNVEEKITPVNNTKELVEELVEEEADADEDEDEDESVEDESDEDESVEDESDEDAEVNIKDKTFDCDEGQDPMVKEPINISLKIEEVVTEEEEEVNQNAEDEEEDEEEDAEDAEDEENGEKVKDEVKEVEVNEDVEESEEDVEVEESEEDVEVEESEEEVKTEDNEEEKVEDNDDEEEEDEEVFEIDINGKTYFTTNASSGDIYEMDNAGDPGDEVGKFVKGIATFTK